MCLVLLCSSNEKNLSRDDGRTTGRCKEQRFCVRIELRSNIHSVCILRESKAGRPTERHDSGQVYIWEMNGLQITAEGGVPHAPVPSDWHIFSQHNFV
jgi:hypothetical protein